jgi:hypothetical protein
MKAKSWKTFVDKEPKKKKSALTGLESLKDSAKTNPIEDALEKNSTLKKLMAERELLEKKMGALTGQTDFGNFGDHINQRLGEIPSLGEKKKEITAWDASRKKALESLKQRQSSDRQTPTGLSGIPNSTNASPLEGSIPAPRFAENLKKKKEVFGSKKKDNFNSKKKKIADTFEKKAKDKLPSGLRKKKESIDKAVKTVKKKKDDWLEKKEKLESKLKNAKKEVGRFTDSLEKFQKSTDQFGGGGSSNMSDIPDLGGEISKIKDRFATDSKVGKKMKKMTESFEKKRGGEKLDQKWEKVKNKHKQLNRAKSKYEARRDKLLNVNKNTLEELDEKRRALKEQLSAKKKAEKREEERKAKRKEELKAERDAERKEEEKREKRREEKKRQKKERF